MWTFLVGLAGVKERQREDAEAERRGEKVDGVERELRVMRRGKRKRLSRLAEASGRRG